MPHPLHFRPGTCDEEIFNTVVHGDEYHLPERFDRNDIILDIGTHIGSFCYAALERGARHIVGYEANPENFRCAVQNLSSYGDRVRLFNKAVWRSDRAVEKVHFTRSDNASNTGGGGVLFDTGDEVPATPLDRILADVTENGQKRIRFLKIDCEGAEYPILLTSKLLSLIDEVAGEFHEPPNGYFDRITLPPRAHVPGYDRYSIHELIGCLHAAGFTVESEKKPGMTHGIFIAKNKFARKRWKWHPATLYGQCVRQLKKVTSLMR